jgi:hypothetical protein
MLQILMSTEKTKWLLLSTFRKRLKYHLVTSQAVTIKVFHCITNCKLLAAYIYIYTYIYIYIYTYIYIYNLFFPSPDLQTMYNTHIKCLTNEQDYVEN